MKPYRLTSACLTLAFSITLLTGCSRDAKVTGTVTSAGEPLSGTIVFSPLGKDMNNTGPVTGTEIGPDGRYTLTLRTSGPHTIVIRPASFTYPPRPGQDSLYDLRPIEREITSGRNDVSIEVPPGMKR
jgi:hypothetical protein